jgi:transposase-like protein
MVSNRDEVLAEIARKHATTESLANWIRTLPQRDDDGDEGDGPKVKGCKPVQRLRLPAADPNCVVMWS